jgi:Uma2 family endonuclease
MTTTDSETGFVLGFDSAGVRMTPEEFDAIDDYDDTYNYELVDGVLVVGPLAAPSESSACELLGYWLWKYGDKDPRGKSLDATVYGEYLNTKNSLRRTDRAVWTGLGRRPRPNHDTPTIVVDFVSSGKRSWLQDYIKRGREYLKLGVSEYWIVDRFQRTLTVYLSGPAGTGELVVREQETYRSDLLPGFELPLAKLLAEADRWSDVEET